MTVTGDDPVAPCAFCGIAGVPMVLQDVLVGDPARQQTAWVCADVVPCLDRWWAQGKVGPPPVTSDSDTWPAYREHPFE